MQERTNQIAETSPGIFSSRPGRGFPLRPTSPPPHHGHGTEPGLATAERKRVGWRYCDLLAEAESGPGVGIQWRWEQTGSDGLAVQSQEGEKPSGRRRMAGGTFAGKEGGVERKPSKKKNNRKKKQSHPKTDRGCVERWQISPPSPASGPSGAGVGNGVRRWGVEGCLANPGSSGVPAERDAGCGVGVAVVGEEARGGGRLPPAARRPSPPLLNFGLMKWTPRGNCNHTWPERDQKGI